MYNKSLGQITNNNEFNLLILTFQKRIFRNIINIARKAFFLQNGRLVFHFSPPLVILRTLHKTSPTCTSSKNHCRFRNYNNGARVFSLFFSFSFFFFFRRREIDNNQRANETREDSTELLIISISIRFRGKFSLSLKILSPPIRIGPATLLR